MKRIDVVGLFADDLASRQKDGGDAHEVKLSDSRLAQSHLKAG